MKKKILATALATVMAVTGATAVSAVELKDTISGDLTVTNFFNEKTDAVAMKDGDSFTFKFNNKSNGTANWENYILAVTGAVGDAYTGAAEEVLIIRADNWGWGGGLSDFAAPDAADGNKLAFENNIWISENENHWPEWAAMMQQGCDVNITLTKNGNTITYKATMGDYSINLTATNTKVDEDKNAVDLPDTVYVFLTGENCVLTGITVTDNNAKPAESENTEESEKPAESENPAESEASVAGTEKPADASGDKNSPDTGAAAPLAVAALAIVSVGTVLVLKKKK